MKCDRCGKESDFEAGFIKRRKSFSSSQKTLCPSCWKRHRHAVEGWYHIGVLCGGILGYVLLGMDPLSLPGRFLTTFFLVDVFFILSIIPHELGHAMAGRLAGWRVFAVVFGVGQRLFKFHFRDILFSFHAFPLGGYTRLAPVNGHWFRLKRFFVYFAGPAVNGLVAGTLFWIWRASWNEPGTIDVRLCCWANLWVMAVNLFPFHSKTLGLPSDGKQLLKTFFKTPAEVEELRAQRFAVEALLRRDEYKDRKGALEWSQQGLALFPSNFHLLNIRGILCLDQGDYLRAREIFHQIMPTQKPSKSNLNHYLILNNIAYVDVLLEDPALLAEADDFSKQAYQIGPWEPSFIGTRGSVLVAMGKLEEGIKLLNEAFQAQSTAGNKAENACHLAVAHARMKNLRTAEDYLDLARQLDPDCRSIIWSAREIQSTQTAVP